LDGKGETRCDREDAMRLLKRGVRGEDVLNWQQFLLQVRSKPAPGLSVPVVKADGIFGGETQRATRAFQQRVSLNADGIVGPKTIAKAKERGLVLTKAAISDGEAKPVAVSPPAPSAGNTREESFRRLRAEGWKSSGAVAAGLVGGKAHLQSVMDGSGDFVYDEYAILVDAMPPGTSAEKFLLDMATDLNGTVKDSGFNVINVFERRRTGSPQVGEIIDIDIMGPDNGSVILAVLRSNYFVFQTVDCDKTGTHPENGSREFGFERVGAGFRFYTRGVSRPGNAAIGLAGAAPQMIGWTRLMRGISDEIARRGGKPRLNSFTAYKRTSAQ
jgi:peptidoglycan hydrolase-like protein with peptidoglycan-binding domain